uniref:Uncharacterized protein n=1 Tax=Ditylenchus dipsaci TaxID=166011 RepID=A0A915D0V7_9BILA
MSGSGIGANVFITGANRGIGLGLVKEIAKVSGIKNIFAGCRDPTNAKDLNEIEKSTNSVVKLVQFDVQNDDSIKSALHTVKKSIGGGSALNLLINNAGILTSKAL